MTYQEIIEQVSQGAYYSVDFKKRSLRLNGKAVEISQGDELEIERYNSLDEWLDKVEELYDAYKYSKPTKLTIKKQRRDRFKALSVSELIAECGHDALNTPVIRDVAKAELEVFILLSLINGSFNPDELFAKDWFYQGSDKTFIMRKDWF